MKDNLETEQSCVYFRTDLACELPNESGHCNRKVETLEGEGEVSIIEHWAQDGGQSITLQTPRITLLSCSAQNRLIQLIAEQLGNMVRRILGRAVNWHTRILVAGLGNPDMTPDAVGPLTIRGLTPTRHLKELDNEMYQSLGCCEVSAISPLVLGQTGVESGEVIRGVIGHVKPDLLLVVDALAARSCERLACTFQFSDDGISPGAGVGNHRMGITRESMGVPVLAIGVPTVVDSATLVYDALMQAEINEDEISPQLKEVLSSGKRFVVSPKDCDLITETTSHILSRAINLAFGVPDL